jgi:opacity protein-like surface antigen
MRHLIALIGLLGFVGVSVAAPLGSNAPKVGFGLHGNFTQGNLPGPAIDGTKSLNDAYGPGLGGGAHLDLGLPGLSLRLSGDYLKYSLDQGRFRDAYASAFPLIADQTSVQGGGLGIRSVSANVKVAVMPLPVVRPYVTGGVGLAWLSTAKARTFSQGALAGEFPVTTQNGKKSYNLGAGVDLEIGIKLFVEARYVWILTEGEKSTYLPVAVGVTF